MFGSLILISWTLVENKEFSFFLPNLKNVMRKLILQLNSSLMLFNFSFSNRIEIALSSALISEAEF